jgi:hypothetical protein
MMMRMERTTLSKVLFLLSILAYLIRMRAWWTNIPLQQQTLLLDVHHLDEPSSFVTPTTQNANVPLLALSPWEKCMVNLDPAYYDTLFLHTNNHRPSFPRGQKDPTITLRNAFLSNDTVIYFLHQRKAGGTSLRSILYESYIDVAGWDTAYRRSFVPCYSGIDCSVFELPLVEANSLGSFKLLAAHMSYHVPFARAIYETQVLITNMREPIARIKSCMLYRYFFESLDVFSAVNFTVTAPEQLLMHTRDKFNSTCIQEPFRILSPFDPDKEPVSVLHVHEICCLVKTMFHVIRAPGIVNATGATAMENELSVKMRSTPRINKNGRFRKFSKTAKENLKTFLEYIEKENPFVQSELLLYDCLFRPERLV